MNKILVVDDHDLTRMTISRYLEDSNYDVLEARNGLEALKLWEEYSPEIVITDLDMPEMDGFDLIREIRRLEQVEYTFFLVLTASHDIESLERSFELGSDDYLQKPVSYRELKYRIKAAQRNLDHMEKKSLIYALAQLTEARDYTTGSHVTRIASYSVALARYLKNHSIYSDQITTQYISKIELSSVLHDIGKVGISDHLLKSTSVYTPEERIEMQRHTEIGAQIIKDIYQNYPSIKFLTMAHDVALYHHEKYDGSGYPKKLKGNDIPLCARIVAVADVFDALISQRPYKKAYTLEDAKKIIAKSSGTHFDPIIVDAFMQTVDEFMHQVIDKERNLT